MSCHVVLGVVVRRGTRLRTTGLSSFVLFSSTVLYCFAVRSPIRSTLVTCIALQPRYDTGRRCSGRTHRPAPSIRRVLRCAATGSAPGSAAKSLLSGLAESSLCRPLLTRATNVLLLHWYVLSILPSALDLALTPGRRSLPTNSRRLNAERAGGARSIRHPTTPVPAAANTCTATSWQKRPLRKSAAMYRV